MAVHFHPLQIQNITKETDEAVVITFAIPIALQSIFGYTHGQNITLKAVIDNEEVRRSYSICTAPHQGILSVAIKQVLGGKFSSFANQQLKKGDTLQVLPPTGKFSTVLNKNNTKQYLAIAAGSGITPILSIITSTLYTEPNSSFTLLYSNKNKSSIMFFEALQGLKNKYPQRFNLINLLSRERTDAEIFFGRIDLQKLQQLNGLLHFNTFTDIFICGPETMIFCATEYFASLGIAAHQIHFELFGKTVAHTTKVVAAATNNATSNITIKVDGRSFDFAMNNSSSNILDEALKQGADLPFACKGGVCCTCKAKLVSGQVTMDANWGLEHDELAQGFILTCQAHPTTPTVVINFDER